MRPVRFGRKKEADDGEQPYKKGQDFLQVNPLGLVPALEDHGHSLYESDVLVEYLEDRYPASEQHP